MNHSYLAGIIDGEGSIMLPRTGQRKNGGMYTSFTLKMSIANTDLGLLSAICSSYGGMIRQKPTPPGNFKTSYALVWFGEDARRVLDLVYPDLIVKRRVADLAYKYFSAKDASPLRRFIGRPIEEVVVLNGIADEIKTVNRRGAA